MRPLIWLGLLIVGLICLGHGAAEAQFNGCREGFCQNQASAGFTPSCSQSSAFLARATSVTSNTDKTNYDNLICGLVTDSVWTKLDALYVYAAVDRTTAVLNLVQSSFACVEHGTVNFSAKVGYTGDGSTFFLDTQYNPNTAGGVYVQDSASFGVYVLNNRTTTALTSNMGTANTTNTFIRVLRDNAGTPSFQAGVNSNATIFQASGPDTSQGFWVATRTASNAYALYRNGNTTAIGTDTSASTSADNVKFAVFDQNATSAPIVPTTDQMSAAFIGSGLSSADQQKLSNRLNTYMTAYAINVY